MNTTALALPDAAGAHETTSRRTTAALALLALGIVYGDIGTSPLYAAKETFSPSHGIPLTPDNVLGGVSAIFWALMIVVSLKYVALVLRATNRGEGGIMALLALALSSVRDRPRLRAPLLVVGVAGASLFYGDAVLTPAISVLSAIEGLEVGTDLFGPWVVPISVGVLAALFALQRYGTAVVGMLFGPICLLWFVALAAAGAWNVAQAPQVLAALDPRHAIAFATEHGFASFVVLGSALLAFTGAEALYADVGHFGKRAVRLAWFTVAAPALLLNYFGQGALLIVRPEALANPFYLAFPAWALYPMVGLATAATVIASQATISGAYSLTQQAIQLGYLPRMRVVHTSARVRGQIYVPAVNWMLLAAVLLAVVGFGSSSRLASAYGVAVLGTMIATTVLTFFVLRYGWRYPVGIAAAATIFFFAIDGVFFAAALQKVADGGWFPLAIGAVVFTVMTTWRRGRQRLLAALAAGAPPLKGFVASLMRDPPHRVEGTAVYLTSSPDTVPNALLHSLKHFQVLHERNVILTVAFVDVPYAEGERTTSVALGPGFWAVTLRCGFMERPDAVRAVEDWAERPEHADPMVVTYFLSRETVIPGRRARGLAARLRDRLFVAMTRNAGSVTDYFHIPDNRVVELGTRVQM
jgi:KUP system potassium uptake protein